MNCLLRHEHWQCPTNLWAAVGSGGKVWARRRISAMLLPIGLLLPIGPVHFPDLALSVSVLCAGLQVCLMCPVLLVWLGMRSFLISL